MIGLFFITVWFSLDTPVEATTWMTSISSTVSCEKLDSIYFIINNCQIKANKKMYIYFLMRHVLHKQSLYYFHMILRPISSFEHLLFFLFLGHCYLSTWFLSQYKSRNWVRGINVNKRIYRSLLLFLCTIFF